jgi:HSP20 family protein
MFEIIPFGRRNSVSNYDPFHDFYEMERNFFRGGLGEFRTDVSDDGKAFTVEAELPGFKKEDIHLDLDNECLTISAEHTEDNDDSDDKKNYIRRERYYGSFSRSFDVSGIDTDAIKAEYNDGILKLTLPRKEPAAPAAKRLEIE